MPDDDICGYENTTTGDPCQHPAGSCPVPSHSGAAPDGGNPQGRPSKFSDERARAAIHAAEEYGKSKRGCERDAGVARGTLDNWLEANPTFEGPDGNEYDFLTAFRRARGEGETYYITEGRDPEGEVDESFAKFMLASSFDYKKTEATELTGEDGGAVPLMVIENDGDD